MGIEVRLTLSMPRDRSTVPLARRLLDSALCVYDVPKDCREDIELALGEACANAVQHAQAGSDYEVNVCLEHDRCVIEVVDEGMGADMRDLPESGPEDEAGRGLAIIRALSDAVEVRRRYPHGAVVRIVKMLRRTRNAMRQGAVEPPNLGFSGSR